MVKPFLICSNLTWIFVVPLSKQIIMHNACFSAVVLLIPFPKNDVTMIKRFYNKILTPKTNTQSFSNIQICHLTRLKYSTTRIVILVSKDKIRISLQLPLAFIWREETYPPPTQIQTNLRARRKALWPCCSELIYENSREFKMQKKSYPKPSSFLQMVQIAPSHAFRKAKDLF